MGRTVPKSAKSVAGMYNPAPRCRGEPQPQSHFHLFTAGNLIAIPLFNAEKGSSSMHRQDSGTFGPYADTAVIV
jgi:hypothetical protein